MNPLEMQVQGLYTHNLFCKFQVELTLKVPSSNASHLYADFTFISTWNLQNKLCVYSPRTCISSGFIEYISVSLYTVSNCSFDTLAITLSCIAVYYCANSTSELFGLTYFLSTELNPSLLAVVCKNGKKSCI